MSMLRSLVPDVEVLLSLSQEELAEIALQIVSKQTQNGLVHLQELASQVAPQWGDGYPENRQREALIAISEAWNWLTVQGLLIPDPGMNGNNGFMVLSRRARHLLDSGSFKSYAKSISFPKSLLHPRIATEVWNDMSRGDLETAVFKAFREVEIAVREAGSFGATDVGIQLVRKAFDTTKGILTDKEQPEAEREALAHLFAGALGSYKNPHSHRTVAIYEPSEAQEMVILASHLLRIVDSRRPKPQ